jgi:hypothetical protein
MGRGVRQGCSFSSLLFKPQSQYFSKEPLQESGGFKIGGQVISTMKYADDLVLLAKEDTVLQGMTDRLAEVTGCYGMKMNVVETKVMRISRQIPPA